MLPYRCACEFRHLGRELTNLQSQKIMSPSRHSLVTLAEGNPTPSRRQACLAIAPGLALPAFWGVLPTPQARAQNRPRLTLTAEQAIWRAASRFGYGLNESLLATIEQQGARQWVTGQLALAQQAVLQPPPSLAPELSLSLPELFELNRADRLRREAVAAESSSSAPVAAIAPDAGPSPLRQLVNQTLAWRISASTRPNQENPLLARLCEFWFNHLNVFIAKGAVRPFVGHYMLHAIRANCLGRYEDLLLASARHPAMLYYLDQTQSVVEGFDGPGRAKGLNENYARELLELHTLGVDGGYTQTDVRELARILTGWAVSPRSASGFGFRRAAHDKQVKTLLGRTFSGEGEVEGIAALRMLARHPATARRISLRLAQFFVADQPPPALVQRLSERYLATQGNLLAVMQTLIDSPETWDASNTLFKTPMDYAFSVLTAMGGASTRQDVAQTVGFLNAAGQPLLGWQTPDGYSFEQARWLVPEALTRRADYAMVIAGQRASPEYLLPFYSERTRQTLMSVRAISRGGLVLSSPEFMSK